MIEVTPEKIPGWFNLSGSIRADLESRLKIMREDGLSAKDAAEHIYSAARAYIVGHLASKAAAAPPAAAPPPTPSVLAGIFPAPPGLSRAGLPGQTGPSNPANPGEGIRPQAPPGLVTSPTSPAYTRASPVSPPAGPVWPHDDTASLTKFYGDPSRPMPMGKVLVPWDMWYTEDTHHIIHSFSMHEKVVPAMNRIMQRIWDKAEHRQAAIEAAGMHLWGGAYNPRPIRGSTRWSVHAFAAAVDWDPDHNEMNTHPSDPHRLPDWVVQEFKFEGATWGGDFRVRHDPMHMQFAHE